jgi:hypothetical protein
VPILDVKFNYACQALIRAGLTLLAGHHRRVRSLPGYQEKILFQLSSILIDPAIMELGDLMRSKRNLDFYGGGIFITEKG